LGEDQALIGESWVGKRRGQGIPQNQSKKVKKNGQRWAKISDNANRLTQHINGEKKKEETGG